MINSHTRVRDTKQRQLPNRETQKRLFMILFSFSFICLFLSIVFFTVYNFVLFTIYSYSLFSTYEVYTYRKYHISKYICGNDSSHAQDTPLQVFYTALFLILYNGAQKCRERLFGLMKICLPRQVFILPTDSIAALVIEMDTFYEEEKGVNYFSFNKFSSSLKRIVLHFNLFSRVYEYSVCSFHKLLSYVKKARKEKQLTPAHLSKSHRILPVTVSYLKTCKSPVTIS